MDPDNDGFQVRHLLFQGLIFRWTSRQTLGGLVEIVKYLKSHPTISRSAFLVSSVGLIYGYDLYNTDIFSYSSVMPKISQSKLSRMVSCDLFPKRDLFIISQSLSPWRWPVVASKWLQGAIQKLGRFAWLTIVHPICKFGGWMSN